MFTFASFFLLHFDMPSISVIIYKPEDVNAARPNNIILRFDPGQCLERLQELAWKRLTEKNSVC